MIAAVVVEAPFDGVGGQFQRALAQECLEGLEVDGVGGPGSYEAVDFGIDGGEELLLAGFFLRHPGQGWCRRCGGGLRRSAR